MASQRKEFLALWPILISLATLLPPAAAQGPATANAPNLPLMTRKSGYIFTGTVTAVERVGASRANAVATTRITFRVDQAIRGLRSGQTLVVNEWAGLWDSGERYRTGESVLLFLYPLSKLGLTSPVGGSLGRFTLDRYGQQILEQERALALEPDQESPVRLRNRTRVTSGNSARAVQHVAEE